SWLEPGAEPPDRPHLCVPAAALVPGIGLAPLVAAAPGRILASSRDSDAPVTTLAPDRLQPLWRALAGGVAVGDDLRRSLADAIVVPPSPGAWYVRVRTAAAAAEAEHALYMSLGSPIDTPLDVALHRRLSRPVTRAAVGAGISPNTLSIGSLALGLGAAALFALGSIVSTLAGMLLYVAGVVLDHADGEVARVTYAESRLGGILDVAVDTVVHTVLVLAMGVAAQRIAGGGSALLGVAAAAGIAGSAVVTQRWPVTAPGAAGRLLARIGTRDLYYAMLLAFIAARATVPPALPGLMLLIALGAHAYWVGRLTQRPARATEH
ncbi:MAG: CDP-alcohol phosphatidyltransferase family protein, partial [Candidatus Rokuibacteriota bacterium]